MEAIKKLSTEQKMLWLAVITGVAAVIAAWLFLSESEKRAAAAFDPVKVIAAAGYIPALAEIKEDSLQYIQIPKKMVTKAHVTDFKTVKGKMTMVPFIAGEPIMSNKLADRGSELNMAIPTGLRAMSVAVNEESGVGYMIKPGDYVDVLLTFEVNENKKIYTVTATVLQSVQVIAVGSEFAPKQGKNEYGSVTLALSPEEAEIMTFAKEKGRINLALRPVGDRAKEKIKLASFNELVSQIKQNEKGEEDVKRDFIMQRVNEGKATEKPAEAGTEGAGNSGEITPRRVTE